jgi:hypothetical protein
MEQNYTPVEPLWYLEKHVGSSKFVFRVELHKLANDSSSTLEQSAQK